jgi:hypothetical protein
MTECRMTECRMTEGRQELNVENDRRYNITEGSMTEGRKGMKVENDKMYKVTLLEIRILSTIDKSLKQSSPTVTGDKFPRFKYRK